MTDLDLRISLGLQNYHSSAQVVIITNLSLANSCDLGSAILKIKHITPQSYLAITRCCGWVLRLEYILLIETPYCGRVFF